MREVIAQVAQVVLVALTERGLDRHVAHPASPARLLLLALFAAVSPHERPPEVNRALGYTQHSTAQTLYSIVRTVQAEVESVSCAKSHTSGVARGQIGQRVLAGAERQRRARVQDPVVRARTAGVCAAYARGARATLLGGRCHDELEVQVQRRLRWRWRLRNLRTFGERTE